jgi:hypothetical protein
MDETKIRAIIEILMKNEDRLTDGYQYYVDKDVYDVLREIAIQLLEVIGKSSTN